MPNQVTSWEFYSLWWTTAFRKAWDAANTVSLLVGILAAFLVWLSPERERLGLQLTWLLPLVAFGPTLLYRLIQAPYLIFKGHETELADLNSQLAAFQTESDHVARHQRIADQLTERHHHATHELLNRPPSNDETFESWAKAAEAWLEDVRRIMRENGCSPQDINHVETINQFDIREILRRGGITIPAVAMFLIRVDRVADISNKYSALAHQRGPLSRSGSSMLV